MTIEIPELIFWIHFGIKDYINGVEYFFFVFSIKLVNAAPAWLTTLGTGSSNFYIKGYNNLEWNFFWKSGFRSSEKIPIQYKVAYLTLGWLWFNKLIRISTIF